MENFFLEHISDLSDRSRMKNIFVFTDFLSADEISIVKKHKSELAEMTFSGGAEGTERLIVRFGDENELFYSEDFPIKCILAEPVNIKFADTLSHRDFLGAIMNLSVERNKIGDIIIRDNKAYIFVCSSLSAFICDNLTKVKHTNIKCSETDFNLNENLFEFENRLVITSSLRADCIISSLYNLSRNNSSSLFESGKVYINSVQTFTPSKILNEEDRVSVRGFGKFIFDGISGKTKKDRIKVNIRLYV